MNTLTFPGLEREPFRETLGLPDFTPDNPDYYKDTYDWVADSIRGYNEGNMLFRRENALDHLQKAINECGLEALKESDPPPLVLEVATGSGRGVAWMRDQNVEAWGVDISAKALSKAPKGLHDRLAVADARALPFKDDTFDLLVAVDFLEHLSEFDLVRALQSMTRVASGMFLVVPHTDSIHKDQDGGSLHRLVKNKDWWMETLGKWGWVTLLDGNERSSIIRLYKNRSR